VAVDDAGLGRVQRRRANDFRLQRPRRLAVDQREALDAVDLALFGDLLEFGDFGIVGGDDQLAELAGRHAVAGAVVV
jgi:hypothetical protein